MKTLILLLFANLGAGALAQAPVSLTLGNITAEPGSTAVLALTIASGGSQPAGVQWTVTYPAAAITAISVTPGPAAVAAAKTISCAGSNGAFVCLCTGINTNLIGDGVLANVSLTLAPAATGQVPVGLAVLLSASLAADAIATIGSGGNIAVFSRFDLNHDGKVDLLDLQLLIQQILSGSTAASDFNADGASNILDVQLLVRGALP